MSTRSSSFFSIRSLNPASHHHDYLLLVYVYGTFLLKISSIMTHKLKFVRRAVVLLSLDAWHFILSLSSVKVFGEWKLCRCRCCCCCHNLLHASLIAMNNKINGVKKGTHSNEVTRCCLFIVSISVWFKGLINIRHIVYTVKVIKEMGWNSMFMFMKITLDEIQQGINDAKLTFEW